MSTRAVLAPVLAGNCTLDEIMSAPAERLCRLAWPLLSPDAQSRELADIYVPPPMRISASPKANEQTFHDRLNENARDVMAQIDEHSFEDSGATAHRLRAALFRRAMEELRRDVSAFAAPPLPPSLSHGPEPTRDRIDLRNTPPPLAGRTRTAASTPGAVKRSTASSTRGRGASAKGRGAGRGASLATPTTTPPSTSPARASRGSETDAGPPPTFCEVRKPHAVVAHVLDPEVPWAVVEADVAELVAAAVGLGSGGQARAAVANRAPPASPALRATGAEAEPDSSAASSASAVAGSAGTAALVCAAAGLCVRVATEPRAARAFVKLMRAVLARERELATAAAARASDSGGGAGAGVGRKTAGERGGHALAAALDSIRAHQTFVTHVLVPLLHLVPLAEWGPRELVEVGNLLIGACAPRVARGALAQATTTPTRFIYTTAITLEGPAMGDGEADGEAEANPQPARGERPGAVAGHPSAHEPRLGGTYGDEWEWDGPPSSSTSSSSSSPSSSLSQSGQAPFTSRRGPAAADDGGEAGGTRDAGGWASPASLELPGVSTTAPTSSALAAATVTGASAQTRVAVLRAPHAQRVVVRVRKAVRCDHVRLLFMPPHPSQASGGVRPECEVPVAGKRYTWEGPCELLLTYPSATERTGLCSPLSLPSQAAPWLPPQGRGGRPLGHDPHPHPHPHPRPPPTLLAEVATELRLDMDTRWDLEWALALLRAQRYVAAELLADLQAWVRQGRALERDLPAPVFRQGLAGALAVLGRGDGVRASSPPHPFVAAVRGLSSGELRLRTRCRACDVPGVRAVLVVAAHLLTGAQPNLEWSWRTPAWLDAVRRVSLSSASLDARTKAEELAAFIVGSVDSGLRSSGNNSGSTSSSTMSIGGGGSGGSTTRPAQIVDAVIQFFSRGDPNLSARELEVELRRRRSQADAALVMLRLLERVCDQPASPLNLTLVACTLKSFLVLRDGHYLSSFTGCGLSREAALRQRVHATMGKLYAFLRGLVASSSAAQGAPQRYLFEPWSYGAFAILTVSLLVSQLDGEDMVFVSGDIAAQVTSMLPAFTNLTRTESFLVSDGEEVSFAKVFAEYFSHGAGVGAAALTATPGTGTAGDAAGGEGQTASAFDGFAMVSAVWERTGGARRGSGGTTAAAAVDTEDAEEMFAYSKEPLFSLEWVHSGGPKTVHVHLRGGELEHFYIGLATPAVSLARPDLARDPEGIYYLAAGSLSHAAASTRVPPLRAGDVLSFSFSFETVRWRVGVVLNGFLLASFAAPAPALYLLLGSTDTNRPHGVYYRPSCGRPVFSHRTWSAGEGRRRLRSAASTASPPPDSTPRSPLSPAGGVARRVRFSSTAGDVQRLRLLCRGPHMKPTLYNTSLYAALAFHYLVLTCVKRLRQRQTAGLGGPAPVPRGLEELADLRSFVDRCGAPLRRNVQLLVRSLSALTVPVDTVAPAVLPSDTTERVKRQTAFIVYNNLLLDYTISLAVTLRGTSSPVAVMDTLTDVACCAQAAAKTRSVALSAAHGAVIAHTCASAEGDGCGGVSGGGGGGLLSFRPERLWACCCELARDAPLPGTLRPVFTWQTVPVEVTVRAGGRSIAYGRLGPQRSCQRTTSYARDGIPLDGSCGDVVSFSARLQRGFQTDSLGRFYHVGVACCVAGPGAARTLVSHPGDRQRQHACYSLTDHYQDTLEPKADSRTAEVSDTRAELRRHNSNWLSPDDGIVFGSGDVITVTVHCKQRCIRFERNGRPLGVLYRSLPASVHVLFPFVELYNRDSMAKWMYTPNELLVHARYTMRAMLGLWGPELLPRLRAALAESSLSGDCTPMQILGADGDELSFVYRAPPRSEALTVVQEVRLVRTEGRTALVEDDSGAAHGVVAAALEPNHGSYMDGGGGAGPALLRDLLQATLAGVRVDHVMTPTGLETYVEITHPGALLRQLRLLAELDEACAGGLLVAVPDGDTDGVAPEEVAVDDEEEGSRQRLRAALVTRLLDLLRIRSLDLPGAVLLREAWNELCWPPAPSVGSLRLRLDRSGDGGSSTREPSSPASVSSVRSCVSAGSTSTPSSALDGRYELRCPTCGEPWAACTGAHPAPATLCALCDAVLRRCGLTSGYTGWRTTWSTRPEPGPAPALAPPRPPPPMMERAGVGQPSVASVAVSARSSASGYSSLEALLRESAEGAVPGAGTGDSDDDFTSDLDETTHDTEGATAAAVHGADFHPVTITFEFDEGQTAQSLTMADGGAGVVRVRGKGETPQGAFTLEGRLMSSILVTGRIVFDQARPAPGEAVGEVEAAGEWSCAACTFANTPDTARCDICGTPRPGTMWTCSLCSYTYNPNRATMCATCGQLRTGAGSALRSLLGLRSTGSGRVCSCEECHTTREFRLFRQLSLYQACDRCRRTTRWLPKDPFTGTMEARLVGDGDQLELMWHVDGSTESAKGLWAGNYSAARLAARVRDRAPPGSNELSRYVPPLLSRAGAGGDAAAGRCERDEAGDAAGTGDTSSSCLPSAIVYYASRLALRWAPDVCPEVFASPAVLTRLVVFSEDWLKPLRTVSLTTAAAILHTCLWTLFSSVRAAHVVQSVSCAARVLMKAHPSLQDQRHYLLYALCTTACRCSTRHVREACLHSIANLFEDFPYEWVNAQSLGLALRRRPVVAGQQRAMVHAALRRVGVGELSTASTKAAACLARALYCMDATPPQPLPRLLDGTMSEAFPYVVALAETRMNEGGQLQVGQVRGSVGYAPTKGGRYYYEVVLPSNFAEASSTVVMGWGTLQHEHLSSSQHVGSDLHSWGFNCRDRLRLMMSEQLVAVPQRPAPGDVVGSMMDLETMMVCWSINGVPLTWFSVPAQGESELIYPFVSAAVEPGGVEVRLGHTHFCPPDYRDYSTPADDALWSELSDGAPPQPYAFYRELCTLLDEVGVTDLTVASSVAKALASPRAQRALAHFPSVAAQVPASTGRAATADDHDRRSRYLLPYVRHLSAISDLTVMVARNYPMIKESPLLTECYVRAKDLLFSSARWIIFETQIGGRPTFNANHTRTVRIDLERAREVTMDDGAEVEAGLMPVMESARADPLASDAADVRTATTTPTTTTTTAAEAGAHTASVHAALMHSVTGQLFSQIETAPIYKNAMMFSVRLAGGVTTDAGGVTRFILSMLADELNYHVRRGTRCDPAVPLFRLCGHSTVFTVVPNMELLLLERSDDAPDEVEDGEGGRLAHRMLTWLGMLMGNIVLCGTTKLTLNFPRIAWKYLTYTEATIEDYYVDVDDAVRGSLADDAFLLNDEYYLSIPGILQQQQQRRRNGLPSTAGSAVGGGGGGGALGRSAIHSTVTSVGGSRPGQRPASTSVNSMHAAVGPRGLTVSRPLRPYSCMTPAISMMDLTQHMTHASSRPNLSAAWADDDGGGSGEDDGDDDAKACAAAEAAAAAARAREARRRRADAEQALLHQYDAAFQCMRNGLASVLSLSSLRTIRWDDLQSRICGTPTVAVEHVMASLDCATLESGLREMLFEVLTDMTERERARFLLFCSGQSRLPLPEKVSVTSGDDPTLVPTAHTCSPMSLRLQPYKSVAELRQKLELCLSNAKQFGFV